VAERPTHIEEVIVCDPSSANVARAKRLVERLARAGYAEPAAPAPAAPTRTRSERGSSGASGSKRSSADSSAKKRGGPRLRPDDIANARARSSMYDRSQVYGEGDFFIHPVFGVGKVMAVKPERMVVVLFENGDERTMIHAR
jgi:hypothetical protein